MKFLKKPLTFFLSICLICSLFAACDSGSGDNESTVSVEFSTADINFVDADGESTYQVIRSLDATEVEGTSATKVFRTIKEKYGVSPKNTTDSDSDGVGIPEILIGKTSREQSHKAREWLFANGTGRAVEYLIAAIDEDIVIYGMSDNGLTAAVDYFCETYLTGQTVTGGIEYSYVAKESYADYDICGTTVLSKFQIVRPIYNVSYLTQVETEKMIDAILKKTGYQLDMIHDNIASNTGNNTDGSGTLTPTEAAEYEIIIGNATRDGVKTFTDLNAYEIRIEGKKIYLNGGSPYATAMAVTEFTKLFENGTSLSAENSVASGDYNAVIGNYDTATYYRPTWQDDFNGTEIDSSKWTVRWDAVSGYGNTPDGKATVRGSSALKNNYVQDGKVYIAAAKDDSTYYGGLLDTIDIMFYRYGYLEISTLHPKGDGFWTAMWSNSSPDRSPSFEDAYYFSETNVEECYGDGTWSYGNTFAWPTQLGRLELEIPAGTMGIVHNNNRIASEDDRGFYMDFHTFGYEWNGNTNVKFTCDGYVYVDLELDDGAEQIAYEQPAYLKFSMACGSSGTAPTTDPVEWEKYNKFVADYVHIYQVDGQELYEYDEASKKIHLVS